MLTSCCSPSYLQICRFDVKFTMPKTTHLLCNSCAPNCQISAGGCKVGSPSRKTFLRGNRTEVAKRHGRDCIPISGILVRFGSCPILCVFVKSACPFGSRLPVFTHVCLVFSRMRSEGFSFIVGVWGLDCVRLACFLSSSRGVASSLICPHWAKLLERLFDGG